MQLFLNTKDLLNIVFITSDAFASKLNTILESCLKSSDVHSFTHVFTVLCTFSHPILRRQWHQIIGDELWLMSLFARIISSIVADLIVLEDAVDCLPQRDFFSNAGFFFIIPVHSPVRTALLNGYIFINIPQPSVDVRLHATPFLPKRNHGSLV